MTRTAPASRAARIRRACLACLMMFVGLLAAAAPPASAQPLLSGGAAAALAGATIISRDVTVRDGDTLVEIARRELGSGGLAPQLADFNELAVGAALVTGQIVRIPIHVPARGETARVVFVKGEVTIDGAPLERDALIIPGNVLVSGVDGFASIEFSSGSVVSLQPGTTASITRLNCFDGDDSCLIELDTEGGELRSNVKARDGQPAEFRISTPYASTAVRGTEFNLVIVPRELRAAVTEGDILVEALGESQALDTGFGSVTLEGQPPGPPVPLLPAPVFRTVPTRAAAGDPVAWFALRGVDRYALTLALDSEGARQVLELESEDERIGIPPNIASGDYYLTLRGIDGNGLTGFESTVLLGLVDVDPDIPPLDVTVTREGQEFLVAVNDPPSDAAGFEIQVSSTPDFADPLSVEVAETGRAVLNIDTDTLYARARTLIDPRTVSAFGPTASGQ